MQETPEHGEHRLFGPPGTGKTWWLARQVERAVDKYGKDNVIVASYTRTAAFEIISRIDKMPRDNAGTLHALCYRALGSPPIAETHAEEFNENHQDMMISSDSKGNMDEMAIDAKYASDGDALLAKYRLYRARLIPFDQMEPTVQKFAMAWEKWKGQTGYIDFTDMIAFTLLEKKGPPEGQEIGFYDEAQDFNRMELSLVRMWGSYQRYVILAGDDDQALYSFSGATPDAFLDPPVDRAHKTILTQSWRVPAKVHAHASKWIEQLSRREPKEYKPRNVEGELRTFNRGHYKAPEFIIDDAMRYVDQGKTVMFLTSCGYMLNQIKAYLRENGIPFHNPYRKNRGDWNPLGAGGRGRVSSKDRLLAFFNKNTMNYWNWDQFELWIDMVRTKDVLQKGMKTEIENMLEFPTAYTYDEIVAFYKKVFKPEALDRALDRDLGWLEYNLLKSKESALAFPIKILKKRGEKALNEKPKIIISTIHGVKGGEADCSPYDEPVLTTKGYKPIGELDPENDRLVSFNSDHHKIHRGGPQRPDGYKFKKGSRPYDGTLFTLETKISRTRITPNHKMTIRWAEKALHGWCVYLMRKENLWRIGITRLHQTNNQSGLLMRMRREKADAGWILQIFNSQHEALYYETLWGNLYGVPDLVFEQNSKNENQLKTKDLDKIWQSLDTQKINDGALALLKLNGRDEKYPLFDYSGETRRIRQSGLRNRWTLRACNLLPGYMEVPCDPGFGQNPLWLPFTITKDRYVGQVYSLDVERWHHYVSGGTIVHNCVYLFPDLSLAAMQEWQKGGEEKEAIIRMFYVGMTRARESLIFCPPYSRMQVTIG